MSSNYQIYRQAACIAQEGWTQRSYVDEHGNRCLVGAVLLAACMDGDVLPADMVGDLDFVLSPYPVYQHIRAAYLNNGQTLQGAIMAWNDHYRTKRYMVVRVLNDLSYMLMQQEIKRLKAEVERLKRQAAEHEASIQRLEAENTTLRRRLANYLTLRSERSQFQQLSDELEETRQELTALSK